MGEWQRKESGGKEERKEGKEPGKSETKAKEPGKGERTGKERDEGERTRKRRKNRERTRRRCPSHTKGLPRFGFAGRIIHPRVCVSIVEEGDASLAAFVAMSSTRRRPLLSGDLEILLFRRESQVLVSYSVSVES